MVDLTYLPRYVPWRSAMFAYGSGLSSAAKLDLFLLILRIIMNVAAAVALVQHAEKLLSWLVKDSVSKKPASEGERR